MVNLLNSDSFEKVKTVVGRFLIKFGKFRRQVEDSQKGIKDLCSEKFKVSKMGKRMEFLDNGQDKIKVLNKLRTMYLIIN